MAIAKWVWKETAEVLGVVGIIAGIVFLGYELRQNNDLLEAEVRFNHKEARSGWFRNLATNPHLTELIVKAQEGELLSSSEVFQLESLYRHLFTEWEWEVQEAPLRERLEVPLEGYRIGFGKLPGTNTTVYPGIRETWEASKATFAADFVEFVEENVVNER